MAGKKVRKKNVEESLEQSPRQWTCLEKARKLSSMLSCNAILSSGFLVSKVRKVIHSVCPLGDMADVFTVSSSSRLRANLSFS